VFRSFCRAIVDDSFIWPLMRPCRCRTSSSEAIRLTAAAASDCQRSKRNSVLKWPKVKVGDIISRVQERALYINQHGIIEYDSDGCEADSDPIYTLITPCF
jgi:hypothetical protein